MVQRSHGGCHMRMQCLDECSSSWSSSKSAAAQDAAQATQTASLGSSPTLSVYSYAPLLFSCLPPLLDPLFHKTRAGSSSSDQSQTPPGTTVWYICQTTTTN